MVSYLNETGKNRENVIVEKLLFITLTYTGIQWLSVFTKWINENLLITGHCKLE